jgi:hypothetical protein
MGSAGQLKVQYKWERGIPRVWRETRYYLHFQGNPQVLWYVGGVFAYSRGSKRGFGRRDQRGVEIGGLKSVSVHFPIYNRTPWVAAVKPFAILRV